MTINTLTPAHFDELSPLINKLQSPLSEYSIANLFLFRAQHDYKIVHHGGHIFLYGVTYDGIRYAMPFEPIPVIGLPLLKEIMRDGYSLFPIPEEDLI